MVNLDAKALRFMSAEEFRVLTATEMGMKNHEIVPTALIEGISGLKRGGAFKMIKLLHKHKLVSHASKPYDGFRLTAKGYDFLALKSLAKRDTLSGLGIQIGVGKESDIFTVMTPEGYEVCLKLHRLGRTCFRSVKNNRDYIRQDQHASWIYLSRLSALKEYAFMKALYAHGFPVPEPIDVNRHCVVMRLASGYQLNSIQVLANPADVFSRLMDILVRLAEHGLIHGDFNEFNLLVDDEEKVTVIDFPQMISTSHINAEYYFNRDVNCVRTFFRRRFGFEAAEWPTLGEDTARGATVLDAELKASGWTEAYSEDFGRLMEIAGVDTLENNNEESRMVGDEDDEDDDDDEPIEDADDDNDESLEAAADADEPAATDHHGNVDAGRERQAELDELAELAKCARQAQPAMASPPKAPAVDGPVREGAQRAEGTEPPVAASATHESGGLAGLGMVDLAEMSGALPDAARGQKLGAPSETSTVRSSRALDAKARVKLELKSKARHQSGTGGRRNDHKDREKRKLNASVQREVSGTSGW